MLIQFTMKNWMSFRDEVCFSMVAGGERRHRNRVPQLKKYGIKVLPVSAIYGGNASGKSSFFKAFQFLEEVVTGSFGPHKKIRVEPFLLDKESKETPTEFIVEFLYQKNIYKYEVAFQENKVIKERLIKVLSKDEQILFDRFLNKKNRLGEKNSKKNYDMIEAVKDSTRENQLVANYVFLQIAPPYVRDIFAPVIIWFTRLIVLSPSDSFGTGEINDKMADLLFKFDTGLSKVEYEEIEVDSLNMPKTLLNKLPNMPEDIVINALNEDEYITLSMEEGEPKAKRLISLHKSYDGSNDIPLGYSKESDGTKRLFQLLPALYMLVERQSPLVIFIDEIDRSLHHKLIREFLELYLNRCDNELVSQILFTTHNLMLMDQNLFRKDELWFTERMPTGVSRIQSLVEYQGVRVGGNIVKSYLNGRFGGVPKISIPKTIRDRYNG